MERFFKLFIYLAFCVLTLTACDNSDDIGDLYGRWKLQEMTYNGTTTKPDNMYLLFQSQYVQTMNTNGTNCFGHYVKSGDYMTMKFYYSDGISDTYESDPHNTAAELASYNFFDNGTPRTDEDIENGIYPVNLLFQIDTYNADDLVLSDGNGNRWVFTKW